MSGDREGDPNEVREVGNRKKKKKLDVYLGLESSIKPAKKQLGSQFFWQIFANAPRNKRTRKNLEVFYIVIKKKNIYHLNRRIVVSWKLKVKYIFCLF